MWDQYIGYCAPACREGRASYQVVVG
uniref:Uncharacterized protein n=1 Tax=Arundo donax TaxID=35708 RepID=A0A0A9A6S1_ARUDO